MITTELVGGGNVYDFGRKAELNVPHPNGSISFRLPMNDLDSYEGSFELLEEQKSLRPTTAHLLSLVKSALQNPNQNHCIEFLDNIRNNYVWTSTTNMPTSKGVIVYDNIYGVMPDNSKDLREKSDVRFVQGRDFDGRISIGNFSKDPYLIAHIGEEMIPTLESVFEKLGNSGKIGIAGLGSSVFTDSDYVIGTRIKILNDNIYFRPSKGLDPIGMSVGFCF